MALAARIEAGDQWGIGVTRMNLGALAMRHGQLEEGRASVEEALRLMIEVGDALFAATTRVLVGNAARDLGDYPSARVQYRASLEALAVIDDPVSTAEALEDIALLATATGDHRRAVELVGAADAMRSDVGSVASESLEEEYGEKLAPSVVALGPEAAHEASERGRSLDEAAAITLALEVCSAGADA